MARLDFRKVLIVLGSIAVIIFVPGGIPLALIGWIARKRLPLPNKGLLTRQEAS